MRIRVAVAAVLILVASTAAAGPDKKKADALFKQGRQLLNEKQYQKACAAFEDSHRIDPAIGTVLNVALCYEAWGKLAKAQRAYLEAEKLAAIKGDARQAVARQRADALTPRIPKIAFAELPAELPADLVVLIDDVQIGIDAVRLGLSTDPGKHVIAYTAGDQKREVIEVTLGESETKWVNLRLPDAGPADGPAEPIDTTPAGPPRGRTRRILGLSAGGAGLIAMGAGGVIALAARADYKEAFADHCDPSGLCDDVGYRATRDARSRANVATVIFGAGAAIAATGVVLYLTAPSGRGKPERKAYIQPVLLDGGAALVVGGSL
jgi:tetratricopeptide (TPR) repeat protein